MHVSVRCEFLLGLPHKGVEARLDIGQALSNVDHQSLHTVNNVGEASNGDNYAIQAFRKELSSTTVRHIPVRWVVSEELRFGLQSLLE